LLLTLCGAIAIILLKALVDGLKMEENFSTMGNDDIMRLVMVRDWIAGQSWFDTTQYRLVPPDGVLMHWSRYIDAGIAAVIVPFSWFLPMQTAEMIGVTVWPTLIFVITITLIALGTKRLFGVAAACFAVLVTVFWPLLADLHSSAGNLDHHNVQLLMMVILVYAAVWPGRSIAAGIVGGLAAAFALSIGLESLLFIVAVGVLIFGRCVFDPRAETRTLLVAFCAALALGALVFWLGQTAPARRLVPVCDQLGTPILSVIAIAVIAALAPLSRRNRFSGWMPHLAATAVLTAIGFAIAWPLLGPCIQGPYGNLPPDVQELIKTRITEAKPFLLYAQSQRGAALTFMLPVVAALIAGGVLWNARRGSGEPQNPILGQLCLLGLFGFGLIFLQMRTVILVASVVPAIGGASLAVLLDRYLKTRDIAQAAKLFLLAIVIISPQIILNPLWPYIKGPRDDAESAGANCRNYDTLLALNAVPPGVILNSTNMGAPVLWATDHSTLAAPYHRSAAAFSNGSLGFELEETDFSELARNSGATHVLLCADNVYRSTFLTGLASGEVSADWLDPVPLGASDLRLFAVQR